MLVERRMAFVEDCADRTSRGVSRRKEGVCVLKKLKMDSKMEVVTTAHTLWYLAACPFSRHEVQGVGGASFPEILKDRSPSWLLTPSARPCSPSSNLFEPPAHHSAR